MAGAGRLWGRGKVLLVLGALAFGAGLYLTVGPVAQGTAGESLTAQLPAATVLAATTERIGADDVRDALEGSVLLTQVEACGVVRQGTTTLLATSEGVVGFTNAHVVRGAGSVRLMGAGLGVGEGTVQRFLQGRDAAEIDLTAMANRPDDALEVAEVPPIGTEVYTAGFPGGAWRIGKGTLVALEQRQGWGGQGTVLVVDIPAEEGISGGVVVDGSGRAVGLIAARDPSTGYTIAHRVDDLFTRAVTSPPLC
ncbi:MAG: serine protease [Microthrixaceae bacterium]